MKGIKGKFLKKLKTVKQISYLKPERILQVSTLDNFVDNFPTFVHKLPFKSNTHEEQEGEEEEEEDKENIIPLINPSSNLEANNDLKVSSFRRPDMDSGTLFDPNLLAAFEQALKQSAPQNNPNPNPIPKSNFEPDPLLETENQPDPLSEFVPKTPPGGTDSVIFYTTSLRGIRKTFEDCQNIRFLLESFKVIYYERDVSAHGEFRDELWSVMGERIVPPRLFIRGRYIGGAEEVLGLHEQGRFRGLFRDIPIDYSEGSCNGCCGFRFGLCLICNGSMKVFEDSNNGGVWSKCTHCNENGLIVCPFCS